MVSVIIPSYNRSMWVKEAIDSVLAQTGVEMEIILVDDGSTDETFSVFGSLESRVTYIHQSHAGVSSARNTGIRAASGEWLAFLDSDDLWAPRKLQMQLDYFSRHAGVRICQTEEIWMRGAQRLYPKKYHRKPDGCCFELLLERCLISPSAVMIHKGLLEEVGLFDEALPACEDYDLWLRIGWRHPIGLIPEPLVIKRGGHRDQLSTSIQALDRYRIQALVKLLRHQPLDQPQQTLVLRTLMRKCAIYGNGCKKRGQIQEANRVLKLSYALAQELGIPDSCQSADHIS
jgi:glycosyltransferase involved in cell wall biosynthesis